MNNVLHATELLAAAYNFYFQESYLETEPS